MLNVQTTHFPQNESSRLKHRFYSLTATSALVFTLIVNLPSISFAQESETLEGPNPRVTIIDTTNNQTWVLRPDQNGFYIIDDSNFQSVPIAIRPGARDSAVYIENDSIGMGTTSPEGLLDLRDASGNASVVFNPGSAISPSMVVNEDTEAAILRLQTAASNRIAVIGMTTPNGGHSFRSLTNGNLILRDEGVNRNVITVFKSTLNANLLTLRNGRLGVGRFNPGFPLHMKSGARCTVGGVWTNASSRDLKQNIKTLGSDEASAVVSKLRPVTYQYKSEPTEDYVGFIAEDVPGLVATNDRKSLAAMDVVAVLTKVVQDQQVAIEKQAKEISDLKSMQAKHDAIVGRLAEQEIVLARLVEQFASASGQSGVAGNAKQSIVSAR